MFIICLILILAVFLGFTVYSKPVHAVLVDYSAMKQAAPNLYVEPGLPSTEQEELLRTVESAESRIINVFGGRSTSPKIIFAVSQKALHNYAENPTGQTYYYPWNNYIVIGPEGLNEGVISHELTHAELRGRLHNKHEVPAWFDEGLATMVDGRYTEYERVWNEVTAQGKAAVNYGLLESHKAFDYGTADAQKNYNLACYEVSRWFKVAGQDGLLQFIDALNTGGDFKEQYNRLGP